MNGPNNYYFLSKKLLFKVQIFVLKIIFQNFNRFYYHLINFIHIESETI